MLISFSIVLSHSWVLVAQSFESQQLFKAKVRSPAARGECTALFQSADPRKTDPSSPSKFASSCRTFHFCLKQLLWFESFRNQYPRER